MQLFCLCSLALPLTLTIACANPTGFEPSSLHDTWMTAPENHSPLGWYQRSLTFETNGSFTSEFRS
jgi:hypothetical protein